MLKFEYFNLKMLQRQHHISHQRYSFQQKLQKSQQQLSPDLYQIEQLKQQIKKNKISQLQCANIIQQIIQKISHPILAVQLLTDKFLQMDFFSNTGFKIFQAIQSKAQAIYIESIMTDIKKIQNNQQISDSSHEDIKHIVQQINWKINMQKSIHEPQIHQSGDHVDLMKFFEGVRNYQNWHQNIKKQTIQHLKHKAHAIQINLTLKKGFIISKILKIKQSYQRFFQRQFIYKCQNRAKIFTVEKVANKIQLNHCRQAFQIIYKSSRQQKDSEKMVKLLSNHWETKICSKISKQISSFSRKILKVKLFVKRIQKIQNTKKAALYAKFLQKLNFKKNIKSSNVTIAIQKIQYFIQRKQKIWAMKKMNIALINIILKANKLILKNLKSSFREIKAQADSNIKIDHQLSLKSKGKILNALRSYEQKPIDLRHTFLNWYIKGNQTKFTKQIYNIWMTAATNKFSFFMRLKNLIDENRNYKIKYELKLFLMVLNQKLNKYYNHGKKSIFNKWIQNNRRIRKIQQSFKTLQTVQNENNQVLIKTGFQKILNAYKRNVIMQKFCSKYINKYINNIKVLVDTWKILPDVKKSKGQIIMRKTLRKIVESIVSNKQETFKIFKNNKIEGKDKKVKILRKVFNQDYIYLQRFFQKWRTNKNNIIQASQNFQLKKARTLILLSKFQQNLYKKNIKDIIQKMKKRSIFNKRKQKQTKRVFSNILTSNKSKNISQIFIIFKRNLQQGKQKKINLVKWFVNQNKKNQYLAFNSIQNKSHQNFNLQKIRRTQEIMSLAEKRFAQTFMIFDKKNFVYNFLNGVLANRTKNIHSAFKFIKAMPKRMNWKKRQNAVKFYQTLNFMWKRNKLYTLDRYKSSLLTGRFKMTKSMDIMAAKYFDVTRKYFNIYRKNINRIKTDQINKALGGSLENMNQILICNYRALFIGQAQWKKKSDHLIKLNQRIRNRVGQAFKLWRQTSKAMEYFKQIQNQKKTRYIQILLKALSKNEIQETKKSINMFRKHAKVYDVQLAFLRRLCDSQAGKVVKAMMIWKGLPQPKNRQKIAKATKFESVMAKIGMKNYRKSFMSFKDGHYYGNEKKKYCIRQLVAKSCSGLKSYFESWRGNSRLSIIFSKCQSVSHMVHICQNLQQKNLKYLFEGNQAKQKRNKLQKLQLILGQHKRQLIYLWRQKTIDIKKYENKKSNLLKNLAGIQQNTSNKNVRDYAIKKFLQLRIMKKMQKQRQKQCKLLQVIDKANKTRKQNLSQSFNVFKFNQVKGNYKKKRAFQNWLKDKIGHIHNILSGWDTLSKEKVLQEKRRFVSNNFESVDTIVKANFIHLMANSKQIQLKKKTLNNLFRAQQLKLKGYLILWKNTAKQLKILSQFDKQSKASILERINKIVSVGSQQNIKKAIQKFNQSMKVQMVQKKFINQLLKTKSGLTLQAFNRWKSIPAINLGQRYKKGQKFFNKLQNLYKFQLGFVHKTFKAQQQEGNVMKKKSILQLFDMTSTGIRRYYRRWQKMAKQKHTLNSVSALMKSLDIINQCVTSQYLIIFQDQRAYTIKVSAINKLIAAAQGTTQNYFIKWRDNARQIKIQQSMDVQKKTLALQMFTRALQGSQKGQTVDVIRKFRLNLVVTQISKKFFNRLLQTKTGKLVQLFEKLKNIPDTKVAVKKKKAIKFQGALNRFAMKILRLSFNPFKTCNFVAIDRKKYCINKLVRISMGQQQKKFLLWRNITREDKILSHSSLADKTFGNMQNLKACHLQNLFRGHKQEMQKKKALCRKLVMNSQFVQGHAFMIWRQAVKKDDIVNIKKQSQVKDILRNLINIHNDHEKKSAVGSFGILKNLLMVNKLQRHSQKQKKTHNKAYQFVQKLQKLKKSRISAFIDGCKNSSIQMNFTNKIKGLQLMFKSSTQVYSQNLMMLYRNQRQSLIIENALNRIFSNFKVGTEKAFNLWRQQAKVLKLQQSMGNQKKKNILDILNKFLGNNQTNQVKHAIQSFHTNFKQLKIQKQILMKILNCKAGKVPILFMQWKSLPSQTGKKYKQKAMKFQNALFRASDKRIKFVWQSFKTQSYDAIVKKQYAIRKLIQVTQSDNSRLFNKWRKVNNQAKITQKIGLLDRIMSYSQYNLVQNMEIFNEFKKQHQLKVSSLQKIFLIQSIQLKSSLKQWRQQNIVLKINKLIQAISKFSEPQLQKRFIKQSFQMIKHKFEIMTMKGYINSLWKWKMSNTQANYYEKFIKVFRQSEQLLNLSKLLNKKQSDTIHSAFNAIKSASQYRFNRKIQLVQKYLTKKVRTYFSTMRKNAFRQEVQTWKSKYTSTVKIQQFTRLLSKIVRKQQNEGYSTLAYNSQYISKVIKLVKTLDNYKNNNLLEGTKNIHRYGYYKIIKQAWNAKSKVKNYLLQQSFNLINDYGRMRQLCFKMQTVIFFSEMRRAFYRLRKNSERSTKQKLSLLLLSQKIIQKKLQNTLRVINAFRKRKIIAECLQKIAQIVNKKILQRQRYLFQIDQNDIKIVSLLQRFKKGSAIKNILQKQDKKILSIYFSKLKKKQNPWLQESIRRFATRSSIRSSLSVSIWRLKTYAEH